MQSGDCASKHITIMESANKMHVRLNVLEDMLRALVKRDEIKAEQKGPDGPKIPSLIDEIVNIMEYNNKRIEDLTKFFEIEIVSKLGKL